MPSLSVSALFMSVPACCSSALVSPSPSQSAPPSEGSRGSDPSAPTPVDPAMSTSIRAVIILFFFELFIVYSLPNFCSVVLGADRSEPVCVSANIKKRSIAFHL